MNFTRKTTTPEKWQWFFRDKYGLFIHWGPYAAYGRGEQVLFREHLDPADYERRACAWNPKDYDAVHWADVAKRAGFSYACLTTCHHDGYCLWDTATTDYSSAKQAPGRDFVREYVDAFRAAGLKIGLYYSWLDWRLPAYYLGPERDPEGWATVKQYIRDQITELMTKYGKIDYLFFDGVWPRSGFDLETEEVVEMIRSYQPDILINDRLGYRERDLIKAGISLDGGMGAGGAENLGDFSTPEREIRQSPRLWETCQVPTWRLWGYARGERFRETDYLLDMLCESVTKGGNMILNVGPDSDGRFPREFEERALAIGEWLKVHDEAIRDVDGSSLTEFVTRGYQTMKGNSLYLILRFWDGESEMRVPDLVSRVVGVTFLTTGKTLDFEQEGDVVTIKGLPEQSPTPLFPVIRIDFDEVPKTNEWGATSLWNGDPLRCVAWARRRGDSVMAYRGE